MVKRKTSRRHLKSYLAKFMWQQRIKECKFTNIFKTMKIQFPPLITTESFIIVVKIFLRFNICYLLEKFKKNSNLNMIS